MSGPKVVRVVTREEIVTICMVQLRRLERAGASWEANMRHLGVVDEAASAAVTSRVEELKALLLSDKFSELRKLVPAEIAFLEDDEVRQRVKAVDARAVVMRRARQLKKNAAVLLETVTARGLALEPATTSRLKQVAAGVLTGGPAEALLGDTFRRMAASVAPAAPVSLTNSQREMAARFVSAMEGSEGGEGEDFAKWQAAQAGLLETRSATLEKRLAELSTYLDESQVKRFTDRLGVIDATENESSRNLHLDSLVLDVSAAVSQARQDVVLTKAGREVLAALTEFDGEAASSLVTLRTSLADALARVDTARLLGLVEEGRAALAGEVARQAAHARRSAVLAGLQALGYEVREGMSTAWEQKGRVVLRKPNSSDYGVELSSAASDERMQVRAVAFSQGRDLSGDARVETAWCGDFGKLQSMLASQGGAIDIERSNAIGALPLKTVDAGPAPPEMTVALRART